jgi:pyruvate formate lyase activating enzyme
MNILGFVKTSLVDYPGNIVSTMFLGGCNFKCPFCHNPELAGNKGMKLDKEKIFSYLKKRKGLIDGVCVSGGEPTLYLELPKLLKEIKDLGLLVKVDTNGSNPEMVKKIIDEKLVDYIAMDIKSSFENYDKASGVDVDLNNIQESINILKNSEIDYEFRTTMVPSFVKMEDFESVCKSLEGANKFFIQQFDPKNNLINNQLKKERLYPPSDMEDFLTLAKPYFKVCGLRNL